MRIQFQHLLSSVLCVDFVTVLLSKKFGVGKSVLDKWYNQFGIVAVLSDCLIILIGILLAQFAVPNATLICLVFVAILIQLVHDFLFYLLVINPIPKGENRIIDLFKEYTQAFSWKILVADALMVGSTVLIASQLSYLHPTKNVFVGLLALYGLTYIIYTK